MWIDVLKQSYSQSQEIQELCTKLPKWEQVSKHYSLLQGLLLRKGRIVLVPDSGFKQKVL